MDANLKSIPYVNKNGIAGKKKKTTIVSKILSAFSRYNKFNVEDIQKNMHAIPQDKDLISDKNQALYWYLQNNLSSAGKVKSDRDEDFFDKTFPEKRDVLRNLAVQPELEDILDTMANECITYNEDGAFFAEPILHDELVPEMKQGDINKVNKAMVNTYSELYAMLDFTNRAWDIFKKWLIEGTLAYEIIYDSLEKPKKIIGIVELDPATLTKSTHNNKIYWTQFSGVMGKERKLLDSQIIWIAYNDTQSVTRQSYLERLVRPFNIYRIIEQAQIVWTVANAGSKTKFTIPVKGLTKSMGMQTLSSAMNRYTEDIKFDSSTGELNINGRANIPFNKEYWFPENESGSPEIETLGNDGPELNDNDQLKYFKNQLYKISKIPINRFDQDDQAMWMGTDAGSVARTEIDFGRFVDRLHNVFGQVLLKPLKLSLMLQLPDIVNNNNIYRAITLKYASYNVFSELMEEELMDKRAQFVQSMKESVVDQDADGNDVHYFSSEFLVQRYLHLTPADIKLNNRLKKKEMENLHLAGDDDAEENMLGGK